MAALLGGCTYEVQQLAPFPAHITIEAIVAQPDEYAALAFDWDGSRPDDGGSYADPISLSGTVPNPQALPDVPEPFGRYRLADFVSLAPGSWTFHVTVRDGTQARYVYTCGQEIYEHEASLLVVATPAPPGTTPQQGSDCTCDVGCSDGTPEHDLAVVSVTAPAGAVAGQSYPVSVEVLNQGQAPTETAGARLTDNLGATISPDPHSAVTLTAGVPSTYVFTWTPSVAGPHTLTATVDALPNESNYANNTSAPVTVTVQPATVCPVVSGNSPTSIGSGTHIVTVTGTGFTPGASVALVNQPAPTVTAVAYQSATTLDVTLRVGLTTTPGDYRFVVTNDPGGPNQCVSSPGGLLTVQ